MWYILNDSCINYDICVLQIWLGLLFEQRTEILLFIFLLQLTKVFADDEALINKKLPKELILRIFSYLDVVSLCRCAQVSKSWNVLALDGSNWQRIDLFDFQKDVEVINSKSALKL